MSCYLFVHFKEKTTPKGEQIYFGLSKDGFHWEEVNGGEPILWSYYGEKGVRDHTIVRNEVTGKFYILATDLSLAYGFRNQYKSSWANITRNGSKYMSMWESEDLLNWSEQKLVKVATEDLGCAWAPDIISTANEQGEREYIVHWSSSHKSEDYKKKCIYYSRTMDFEHFTEPNILYQKEESSVIDSAMYEENGCYYLFVKSEGNPRQILLLKSDSITGPFAPVEAFNEAMKDVEEGLYEAPTAVKLVDGTWCLFIDYYGVKGAGQGYIPFIADSLEKANFKRADSSFSFPYGFKHGTILRITEEEYEAIKKFDYNMDDYSTYG